MATNKRKSTIAVVAGVTAAALLLGGTFAWSSLSQRATNESAGVVNVGGRLHDDFNGTNKDIYVENFTDPLDGGQPIYARVKLTEYMEIGAEAGKLNADGTFAADRDAKSVFDDPAIVIDDPTTWPVHTSMGQYADTTEYCYLGDTCWIHSYWQWEVGGQTTYMPTFNKDKDSLEADINGTYPGTVAADHIHYDDYVSYTTDATGAVFTEGTDTLPYTTPIYQKVADAYYDADADDQPNDPLNGIGAVITEPETHTAKLTGDGDVLNDVLWNNLYAKPGNYWVLIGEWFYWANPIMPGEATGLLLDSISINGNPGEKCYYAINAVAEFTTVGDWSAFEKDGTTLPDGAKLLLNNAAANVASVSVSSTDGTSAATLGGTKSFDASLFVGGNLQTGTAATDFEWSVVGTDLKELDSATTSTSITDGVLTVDLAETATELFIVAKPKDPNYKGAAGTFAITIEPAAATT